MHHPVLAVLINSNTMAYLQAMYERLVVRLSRSMGYQPHNMDGCFDKYQIWVVGDWKISCGRMWSMQLFKRAARNILHYTEVGSLHPFVLVSAQAVVPTHRSGKALPVSAVTIVYGRRSSGRSRTRPSGQC